MKGKYDASVEKINSLSVIEVENEVSLMTFHIILTSLCTFTPKLVYHKYPHSPYCLRLGTFVLQINFRIVC